MAREAATQLKLHNIHVSIDDFGAGFSSLARLKELPFVELKLDRSFVDGCSDDEGKRCMCQSVVKLAHRFKMTVVAQGVETADDLKVLIDMGYNMAQGYYLEKPMTGEDFIRYLHLRQTSLRAGKLVNIFLECTPYGGFAPSDPHETRP